MEARIGDVTIRVEGRPRGGRRDGPAPDRVPGSSRTWFPRAGRVAERRSGVPKSISMDSEVGCFSHGAGRKGENGIAPMQPKPQLIVLVGDDSLMSTLADLLEKEGYRVGRANGSSEASRLFQQDRPALVIRAAGPTGSNGSSVGFVAKGASRLGVPLLDIVEDGADPGLLVDRHGDADDWVYRSRVEVELPARVGRLLRRGGRRDAHSGASRRTRSTRNSSRWSCMTCGPR